MAIFALYTNNAELDQICADMDSAKQERKELIAYGNAVRLFRINSDYSGNAELAAYEIDTHMREKGQFGRNAARAIESQFDCKIVSL